MKNEIEDLKRNAHLLKLSLQGLIEAVEAVAQALETPAPAHALDTPVPAHGPNTPVHAPKAPVHTPKAPVHTPKTVHKAPTQPKGVPKAEQMLTSHEVARMLGVKVSTLQNWRIKHYGPTYVKVGNRVRYRWEDLHQFIAARKANPRR